MSVLVSVTCECVRLFVVGGGGGGGVCVRLRGADLGFSFRGRKRVLDTLSCYLSLIFKYL